MSRKAVTVLIIDDSPEDRETYRACFYWPVRGWNLLGDNAPSPGGGRGVRLKRPAA